MVVSIIADIVYISSKWILWNTYTGIKNMIYGKQQDIIMLKLLQLEQKIENVPNLSFYNTIKSKYIKGTWIVIKNNIVLLETSDKLIALKYITNALEKEPLETYLLIQVDNEKTACLL